MGMKHLKDFLLDIRTSDGVLHQLRKLNTSSERNKNTNRVLIKRILLASKFNIVDEFYFINNTCFNELSYFGALYVREEKRILLFNGLKKAIRSDTEFAINFVANRIRNNTGLNKLEYKINNSIDNKDNKDNIDNQIDNKDNNINNINSNINNKDNKDNKDNIK